MNVCACGQLPKSTDNYCGACGEVVQLDHWQPDYSKWRHGGWYVHNTRYPGGGCGCVSRNYADKKWRIVCDPRPDGHEHTYKNRDAAARAERALVSGQHAAARNRE